MKLSRLLSEVRKHASLPSAADAIMVELRLFETQIDTGTTPKSRPSPPASHWTASWASAFYRLQCARAALLEGRTSQAQAAATEVAGDIAMREYPELRLLVQQIAARSCSPSHKQNGIALYRKAILDLTDLDTHGETLDLSHPIWHFCALIRLQIESGLAGSPECAADLNLLRKYLDRDSLRSVIASRGLSPAGFDELRRHITDHSLEAAWSRSGEFLMNRLSQAVRP